MAERTTARQLHQLFGHFCKASGFRVAQSVSDHGAYRLDYYDGWLIERIDDVSCGVSLPFGERRRSAGEMWRTLHFALRLLDQV